MKVFLKYSAFLLLLLLMTASRGISQEVKIKIVAFGDSTTAGTPGFVPDRKNPPEGRGDKESQYAYWVMQLNPEWEVINEGVNAQRSDQILKRFDSDVLSFHPEWIIVLAGVNDLYQGVPVAKTQEYLKQIYARAADAGIKIMTCSVIPYNFSTFEVKERMRQLNEWIAAYSREKGYGYCDTYKSVEDPVRPGWLISSPDGLHPDKAGYQKMGEALSACLRTAIKDDSPPPL